MRYLILLPVLIIACVYAGTIKTQFDRINTAMDQVFPS